MDRKADVRNAIRQINRALADYLGAINALVAIMIPLVMGISMGSTIANFPLLGLGAIGFIVGFIVGFILGVPISVFSCGSIAVLIDIRNSLADHEKERN